MSTDDVDDFADFKTDARCWANFVQTNFDKRNITPADKATALAKFQQRVLKALRDRFEELQKRPEGLTRTEVADRLHIGKEVVTRRLRGTENMTMRSLAEMFLALESEPEIVAHPLDQPRVAPWRSAGKTSDPHGSVTIVVQAFFDVTRPPPRVQAESQSFTPWSEDQQVIDHPVPNTLLALPTLLKPSFVSADRATVRVSSGHCILLAEG